MTKKKLKDGVLYQKNNTYHFFSNIFFDENNQSYFNSKSISSCEQVHSNIITEVINNSKPQCDGIYSKKENNRVLKIRTADCLPILISNDNHLFAIHAGWRGLSSLIINTIKNFSFTEDDFVFIGPHIQTYEVGKEIPIQITKDNPNLEMEAKQFLTKKENEKYLLNLGQLAALQLKEIGFTDKQIIISDIDTLTNPEWNSYRRDTEKAGRNFSYIFQSLV